MSDDGVEEREDAQCWEGKRRTTVLARLVSRRCMYTDGVQTDPAGSNNRCSEVESVPWDELSVFPDTDQSFLDKGLALGVSNGCLLVEGSGRWQVKAAGSILYR
jgi:hypothetical protein